MRILTYLLRALLAIVVIGAGWVGIDTMKAKRKAKKVTAPFGDNHYETVKQTFPENASDSDSPEMIKERQRLAT